MSVGQYNWCLLFVVLACVALHLVGLHLPAVNQEFAFSAATEYFDSGNPQALAIFLDYQANTLGVPMVAYLLQTAIPGVSATLAPRLASMLGIVLMAYAVSKLAAKLSIGRVERLLLLLLLLSNPLIWIFSGRGTADFLPAAFGMLGMAWLVDSQSWAVRIAAALAIGLAIVLKYHAFIYLLFAAFYVTSRQNAQRLDGWRELTLIGVTALLPVSLYVVAVKAQFGFFITPPKFQAVHGTALGNWVPGFFAYTIYLVLLLLPFSVIVVFRWIRAGSLDRLLKLGAVASIFLFAGLLMPGVGGEMNFGPLDRFVSPTLLNLVAGLGPPTFALCMIAMASEASDGAQRAFVFAVVCSVVVFFGVLAFTRPAQRYLILCLPLCYLMMFVSARWQPRKLLVSAVVAACVALNIYAGLYQYVVGSAAREMARQIEIQGLLADTNPGAIAGHVGDRFFVQPRRTARFIVVEGEKPGARLTVNKALGPFINRAYSLLAI